MLLQFSPSVIDSIVHSDLYEMVKKQQSKRLISNAISEPWTAAMCENYN